MNAINVRLITIRKAYKHFKDEEMPTNLPYSEALELLICQFGLRKIEDFNNKEEANYEKPAQFTLGEKL